MGEKWTAHSESRWKSRSDARDRLWTGNALCCCYLLSKEIKLIDRSTNKQYCSWLQTKLHDRWTIRLYWIYIVLFFRFSDKQIFSFLKACHFRSDTVKKSKSKSKNRIEMFFVFKRRRLFGDDDAMFSTSATNDDTKLMEQLVNLTPREWTWYEKWKSWSFFFWKLKQWKFKIWFISGYRCCWLCDYKLLLLLLLLNIIIEFIGQRRFAILLIFNSDWRYLIFFKTTTTQVLENGKSLEWSLR